MVFDWLRWWYGAGWAQTSQRTGNRLQRLAQSFSARQLLTTLFEPWRRIINYDNRTFDAKLRASLDNLISRFVGFGVRFLVLLTAGVLMALAVLAGVIEIIIWPLLPLGLLYCAARSVTG